jgi:hypothetical protein
MAVINGPGISAWAQALPGSNRYTTRATSGSILSPSELTYANLLVNRRKCKQKSYTMKNSGGDVGAALFTTFVKGAVPVDPSTRKMKERVTKTRTLEIRKGAAPKSKLKLNG